MSKNVVQPLAVENYLHNGERACVYRCTIFGRRNWPSFDTLSFKPNDIKKKKL